ncbi:hypothetical protein ARMGADRAFT_1032544 [Armillaria gallica]|uniref:F-box domain-containing protein n=1 Tax=Armillaria gallica TaxID=47427 RepID=A0A2H3D8X2_ARMGA|nr:hypothetical protein ARMGADRAFT_1032544 [Armillaria gallica]
MCCCPFKCISLLLIVVILFLLFIPVYGTLPFDPHVMDTAIQLYKYNLAPSQILSAIADGTHEYFAYQKQILALAAIPGNSIVHDLYCSLELLFSKFAMQFHTLSLLQSPTPASAPSVPLSLSWFDLPLKIRLEILTYITPSNLLTLHMVCQDMWMHVTPLMHSHLQLRLPPGWMEFALAGLLPWEWAAHMEMLVAIFISKVWFPVVSISFHSWPIFQYCFFKFLPNMVVTTTLDIDCIPNGYMIVPPQPDSFEVAIWHELNGIDSYRRVIVRNPPPMSITYLKLHLGPLCPDGRWTLGPPLFFLPYRAQVLYIEQLFHVPHAQSLMRSFMHPSKTFPVYFMLSAVMELDLCLGSFLYHAVRWGWSEMSLSLVSLTIRNCDVEDPVDSSMHLPLTGLLVLEHLKLVSPWRALVMFYGVSSVYIDLSTHTFLSQALSSSLMHRALLDTLYNNGIRFGSIMSITLLAKHDVDSLLREMLNTMFWPLFYHAK